VATLPTLAAFVPTPSGALRPVVEQVSVIVPAALLLGPALGVWLYRTRPGLAWRRVVESAETARVLGIPVTAVKLQAVLAEGLLAGVAGAVLSVDYTQTWAQDMTKGRGLLPCSLREWAHAYWMSVSVKFARRRIASTTEQPPPKTASRGTELEQRVSCPPSLPHTLLRQRPVAQAE
jgi:ABC-type uncharacterized transport system permease subunit